MRYQITFAKASGAGNDFVVIDNREGSFPFDHARFATVVCQRRTGVGADGLLVLEKSDRADFGMKYYNQDGSSGGMCGNGGRCIARYASVAGLQGSRLRFEALGFVYEAELNDSSVSLHMRDPRRYRTGIRVAVGEDDFALSFVDTGAPHAVTFLPDIQQIDVQTVGAAIRNSAAFAPEGVNVNFVRINGPGEIAVRTFERGVEAETLACGTGSIASAIVAVKEQALELPVRVRVRSGETLTVNGIQSGEEIYRITLEGNAVILFNGRLFYESDSGTIQHTYPL